MRTYVEIGGRMDYTPTEDVSVDDVVVLGGRIGVATTDIPAGKMGVLAVVGVFRLPAVTGTAFAPGEALYWDASAGSLTRDGTDDKPLAGYAWTPKVASANFGEVKID